MAVADADQEDNSTAVASGTDRPESAAERLLVRAEGAAALCSASVRTWRIWGTSGKIPRPIYIGRLPFWRYDELKAWVAAGCPDRAAWDAMRE